MIAIVLALGLALAGLAAPVASPAVSPVVSPVRAGEPPRLATRVEVDATGNVTSTLEIDPSAAPGLVVMPSGAVSRGVGVLRIPVSVTNLSGAMAYGVEVRVETHRDASGVSAGVARPTDRVRGIASGEVASVEGVEVPLGPGLPVSARLVPVTRIRLVLEFGGFGAGAGLLSKPRGIAVDPDGNLIVADRGNNRMQVFSPEGRVLREWGSLGTEDGAFDHPEDVALDARRRRLFVCDMNNDRVQVFTVDGRHLASFAPRGKGAFNRPSDIAIAPDGKLFVLDLGNMRVVRVNPDSGAVIGTWGRHGAGPGEFRAPLDIECDGHGRVFITDAANRNVQVFAADGALVATVRGPESAPLVHPTAVVPLENDRMLIADFAEDRVRAFALDGTSLGEFGRPGREPGTMHYPADMKLSAGRLFVSQTAANAVSVFDISSWEPASGLALEHVP